MEKTVSSLRQEAFDKLTALQKIKKNQIENYIAGLRTQLHNTKNNPFVIDALTEFSTAIKDGNKSV